MHASNQYAKENLLDKEIQIRHHSMTLQDLEDKVVLKKFTSTQDVRMQTQVVFIHEIQRMVVQTMELAHAPRPGNPNDCYVYIKSLRIFDSMLNEEKTILCEQLFSRNQVTDLCEASIL